MKEYYDKKLQIFNILANNLSLLLKSSFLSRIEGVKFMQFSDLACIEGDILNISYKWPSKKKAD